MMIKIALITISARAYGGDSYVRRLLPALQQYSKDAHFSVITCDPKYANLIRDGGAVKVIPVSARLLRSGIGRLLWQQAVLPGLLRRLGVDVVYTANNVGLLRSPVPCVIAVRNMEPLAVPFNGTMPLHLRARAVLLRRLTVISISRAARVVAVSQFVRDYLAAHGVLGDKIDVIYHGADGLPADSELDAPRAAIVSASKFVRYANLTTLMRGYASSRTRGVSEPLLFAGGSWDSKYETQVRALARTLGIGSRVQFLGYLHGDDLLRLMRRCLLFVFPSTLEACPFTLLEAMACGAPIITTVAGPMPEIARNAALYFDPTDAEALATHVHRLASDEALRTELGSQAIRRAKDFRWKDNVERLIVTARRAMATHR